MFLVVLVFLCVFCVLYIYNKFNKFIWHKIIWNKYIFAFWQQHCNYSHSFSHFLAYLWQSAQIIVSLSALYEMKLHLSNIMRAIFSCTAAFIFSLWIKRNMTPPTKEQKAADNSFGPPPYGLWYVLSCVHQPTACPPIVYPQQKCCFYATLTSKALFSLESACSLTSVLSSSLIRWGSHEMPHSPVLIGVI